MNDEPLARDAYIRTCRVNAPMLEAELQSLGSLHWTDDDRISRPAEFYADAGRVFQMFKEMKLFRADRERLWMRYQEIRSEATRRISIWKEQSRQKREVVESALNDAYWQVQGAQSWKDLQRANQLLAQAYSWMKDGWTQVSLADDFVHLNDGR